MEIDPMPQEPLPHAAHLHILSELLVNLGEKVAVGGWPRGCKGGA